jgi:serine/threonine protein kinase
MSRHGTRCNVSLIVSALHCLFEGTLAYMSPEVLRSETVGKPSDVYSWSIIMWELLHNELAWKRGSHQKHGLNARVLVEMVAYRRARPPVKERPVDDRKGGGTPPNSVNVQPPLPPDSARIHPQAFGPDVAAPSPTNSTSHSSSTVAAPSSSSSSRPGIHPALVQLLRECWRDDYRRRPSFAEIVKRLSAFREMIRAQLQR